MEREDGEGGRVKEMKWFKRERENLKANKKVIKIKSFPKLNRDAIAFRYEMDFLPALLPFQI